MIAFRVDANRYISTGHMMRCMAIADGVICAGKEAVFIVADEDSEAFVKLKGFQTICIHSKWDNLDQEIAEMHNIIVALKVNCLVIDSYYVTEKYLLALRFVTRTLYIDDLDSFIYPVDILLNYNIYAHKMNYEDRYMGNDTILLIGPKYTPLRPEFQSITPIFRDTPSVILITSGGTDPYNVKKRLTERILLDTEFNYLRICIISGAYEDTRNWFNIYEGRICIHEAVTHMAKLMASCDVAVTAGGSTMYELCACGIPSVSFTFADNQLYGVTEFDNQGLIEYCGDVRLGINDCVEKLTDKIKKLVKNAELRSEQSIKMRKTVNEFGIQWIINNIETIY